MSRPDGVEGCSVGKQEYSVSLEPHGFFFANGSGADNGRENYSAIKYRTLMWLKCPGARLQNKNVI